MESSLRETAPMDVLLVNMPFAPLFRPSLPLGSLKALFGSRGVSSRVLYFTIPFAEQIGMKLYARISNLQPRPTDLAGEFIFTKACYGAAPTDYVQEILMNPEKTYGDEQPVADDFIRQILEVQSLADSFVDQCLERVLSYHPRVVIFSSVFQQQMASLALARRLKSRAPEMFAVFIGNNCHGIMGAELIRQFPFVDAAVSGEPEIVVPQIVDRVLSQQSLSDLRGVYTPSDIAAAFQNVSFPAAVPVKDMDSLPYPDFDDFFSQHEESTIAKNSRKQLHFETSRGCWWGERSHCTFCGLNSESMFYRSKSSGRALEELIYLSQRYPGCLMSAVDTILDMKYFKTFIAEVASRELNLEMFYEVKANLKKEHVGLLSEAGIRSIQPGVESFSTPLLNLMGKGVKALQNIQLLKWCKEYGVKPFWNILFGFADEDPGEYARMARLLPLLTHLPVPQSIGKIRIERFSPNFKYPEQFGFKNVRPYPAYFHIYPFAEEVVANLATYFTYEYRAPQNVAEYIRPLRDEVLNWRATHNGSDLFYADKGDCLLIWDLRPAAQAPLTVLKGLERTLFLACDSISTLQELMTLVEPSGVSGEEVEAALHRMLERGLMVSENTSYLSLAVPLGPYTPNQQVAKKFRQLVRTLQTGPASEASIPTATFGLRQPAFAP